MSEIPPAIDERGEYRGVAYALAGRYANAERTGGFFSWKCRWGAGVAGDEETARRYLMGCIDANLGVEEPAEDP